MRTSTGSTSRTRMTGPGRTERSCDLRRVRLTEDDSDGIAGDQQFLVGRDGIDEQLGIFRGDLRFAGDGVLIFLGVEANAGPIHPGTNSCAYVRRIFSYTSGEHDGVGSAHRRQKGTDVFPRAVAKDFDGQPNAAIVMFYQLGL